MSDHSVADTIHRADVSLSAHAGQVKDEPAVKTAGFLSEIADQPPAFTLAAAMLVGGLLAGRPRLTEGAARSLASLALATWAKAAVKSRVVRTRPYKLIDEGEYETGLNGPDERDYNSFPSGHTANAFAAARAIGRVAPEMQFPALAGAALIGAIQVPRGAHFAADVVAGALLGVAAEAAVDAAFGAGGHWLDALERDTPRVRGRTVAR